MNLLSNAIPIHSGSFFARAVHTLFVHRNSLWKINWQRQIREHILNFRLWFVELSFRLFVFMFKAHKYSVGFGWGGCLNLIILQHGISFKPITSILLCFFSITLKSERAKGVRDKIMLIIVYTLIMSHVCYCFTIFRNGRLLAESSFIRTHTIFKCNYNKYGSACVCGLKLN